MSETWTVRRLLAWTQPFLEGRGATSARLDAEHLLADALGMRRLDLYLRLDQPVEPSERDRFRAHVKRRARGEPVAYILGKQPFHDVVLRVRPGALVPRSETETLVDRALGLLRAEDAPAGDVLDLCTGTGAIALAIAHGLGAAAGRRVVGVELSEDALTIARENTDALGLQDTVSMLRGDLYDSLTDDGGRWALIVANPPYVRSARMATLERSVRQFEPQLALDGGDDGLTIARRIVHGALDRLAPGGYVLLEVGDVAQGRALVQQLQRSGFASAHVTPVGPGPTTVVEARAPGAAAPVARDHEAREHAEPRVELDEAAHRPTAPPELTARQVVLDERRPGQPTDAALKPL